MKYTICQSFWFKTLLLVMALSMSLGSYAFDADPGGGGEGDPDQNVPIDGGLSLLIAAGAGYVAKKAYDKKNSKPNPDK